MRILLITHLFPPLHNAGTENYTLGLAKAFSEKGHEVRVVCAEDWQRGDNYWNGVTQDIYEGVSVYRIHLNWVKATNPNKVLYDSDLVENWLDQFLLEQEIDLVHVTSTMTLGIGTLRSVKRARIPLILSLMDFWFICPSIQLLRSNGDLCDGDTTPWDCQSCLLADSALFRRFRQLSLPEPILSGIFGTSAHINGISKMRGLRGMLLNMSERKESLQSALMLPDKILTHSKIVQQMVGRITSVRIDVLKNGQDLQWMDHPPVRTQARNLRFGYIGQIEKIKGVHVLVEAFQQARLNEHARLDIWGDLTRNIAFVDELRAIRKDNSGIILHGRFEREQLATVLADVDILIVPSIWYENAPLVIQEAFAARIPVITTRLGGMAEAVEHEVNGLLFERNNSNDLAVQLKRVVEEPGLLGKLRSGIPAVKRTAEEVVELERIYHELININMNPVTTET